MQKFEEQKFNIPDLKGISKKNIEEHLKLYSGYVKHANLALEKLEEFSKDPEKYGYAFGEIQRRFAFEFGGMRNHEYYFRSLEGGSASLAAESPLKKAVEEEWESFDVWLTRFKATAMIRGIGWVILSYDPQTKRLLNNWVDEQHIGHLVGLPFVLGMDMFEHAYVYDYQPSGKKQYIEDFFANLNWKVIEQNFLDATR